MEKSKTISTNARKSEIRNLNKNVIHVGIIFFLVFAAYRSLENIQSSLNFDDGTGATSLSVLYAGYFISCIFIGAPMVYTFGPKWAMFIAFFGHTLYIIANVVPSPKTLFPASFTLGLLGSAIWIGQGIYITLVASEYAVLTNLRLDKALQKMHGLFYMMYGFSGPVGSLVSGVVLDLDSYIVTSTDTNQIQSENETLIETYENASTPRNDSTELDKSVCGPNHCPYMESHLVVMDKPDDWIIYILLGIFLSFNLLGIILCGLLKTRTSSNKSSSAKKIKSVLLILRNPDLLLMIMAFVHMATSATMFYGSFLQSFVSCPYGIHMVGYTMVVQGLAFSACTVILSKISSFTSRPMRLVAAMAIDLGMCISWFLWQPQPNQTWITLVYGAIHGIISSTYKVELSSLTSLLFEKDLEAAFAHYNLWGGITHCLGFAVQSKLCFYQKTYISITSLALFCITYLCLEIKMRKSGKPSTPKLQNVETEDAEVVGSLLTVANM